MKTIKLLVSFLAVFAAAFFITASPAAAAFISGGITYALSQNYLPMPSGILGVYVGAVGAPDGKIQVISSERDRATYEHNKTDPMYAGREMTQSYLRLEATIVQGKNILTFKAFEGDGTTVYPTEKRLDRNDAFIIDKVAVMLTKQDVANLKTNGELVTYPNQTIFGATAAADLFSIYMGDLRISIGRAKKLVALDLLRFLHIPQTQKSASTNYDQRSHESGFVNLTPQIRLDGSGTNELEIQFPAFVGWAGHSTVSGTEHRVVLYLRGLLVTGGSVNM